ncbi:MAG TPA: DUF6708 domain-containing protein [Pseudomonas sp.]|uniref:DUF6708 domain-containing protein n=1 Tax=Pseudomonas sp. TaxID=306 RepID=UPI002B49BD58|nr:DUF6708 domain-containing protein [Pseudomonas sp.]HKS12436.1 DUF6708 domain-containing protein [Pseudomonas sp.]
MGKKVKNPRLTPPCAGWEADLSFPTRQSLTVATLGYDTPNHIDDTYLEISRSSNRRRGVLIWLSLLLAASYFFLLDLSQAFNQQHLGVISLWIGTTALAAWTISTTLRHDLSPPRDEPIRLNRARQKIFAYNFKFQWWNPFEPGHIETVAYDWTQVRAESWKLRKATTHGIITTWGVVISIVDPGTNNVIDRFPLTTMGADESAWAYICTYMQHGPSKLPTPGPPRDHDNVPWYNLALRLAPKVKWPEDMDRESRTAPRSLAAQLAGDA